jgi:cystathionine beta-lyase
MYDFDTRINRRGTCSYKWDSPDDPADMWQMWVADMDFASPPEVTRALRARLEHPLYGYSFEPEGLYRAFAAWEDRRCGWKIDTEWIVPAPGGVTSLHFAIEAFTEKGDGVVVQPPVYPPFSRAVNRMQRRLVYNPLTRSARGYRMDLSHLESVLEKKTKLLLLCSPHNPVGRVWTAEELRDLGELCGRRGVIVVSDEIHCDLIMPGGRFTPFASLSGVFAENSVTCVSPSKTFNIPGIGGSFALIPNPKLRRAFCRAGERTAALGLPGLFSGIAAQAAYAHGEGWLDELLVYLAGNQRYLKEFLQSRLASLAVFPVEGTYLAWLDFRAYGLSDRELTNILRGKAGVRLNDGPSFGPGGEGFQRLNFACPGEDLRVGLEKIAAAFSVYEKE